MPRLVFPQSPSPPLSLLNRQATHSGELLIGFGGISGGRLGRPRSYETVYVAEEDCEDRRRIVGAVTGRNLDNGAIPNQRSTDQRGR